MIRALQSIEALGDNDSGARSLHRTCAVRGTRLRLLDPCIDRCPNIQERTQGGEHPMRKMRTVIASFAALSLVLAACGGDDDDNADSDTGSAEATGGGTADTGADTASAADTATASDTATAA